MAATAVSRLFVIPRSNARAILDTTVPPASLGLKRGLTVTLDRLYGGRYYVTQTRRMPGEPAEWRVWLKPLPKDGEP